MLEWRTGRFPDALFYTHTLEKRPHLPEATVVLAARFYNAPLFAWEPLVEPFTLDAALRTGGKPAVAANLAVAQTLNVNLSDAMLRVRLRTSN